MTKLQYELTHFSPDVSSRYFAEIESSEKSDEKTTAKQLATNVKPREYKPLSEEDLRLLKEFENHYS